MGASSTDDNAVDDTAKGGAGDVAAFVPHDHGRCRSEALGALEALCDERGLRLTPARRFVLETLLEAHRAMTAYELLDRLRAKGLGGQPPVVYRALDFLLGLGFVHRIEGLGAFVACTHGGAAHPAAFIVCRECRTVAEIPGVVAIPEIAAAGGATGFAVDRVVIEAEGLCARCRERAA
jgi:Fur family zinc uptake transcriptional regulator